MTISAGQRVGYRSALRSRDLRRLLGSQLINASGSWAYNVALAVFLYERTHSAAWVAAGSLGRFIPGLLFSTYGGVIAERFERIGLMVRLNLIALAVQLGLAVLIWRDGPVVLAIVFAALTSLVVVVYNPSVAAVIPEVTREDDLAAANALNGTIDNLVIVLGPAIGAGLLVVGGAALAVLVNAVSFGVAAVLVSRLSIRSKPSDVTDGGAAGPLRQMAEGFRAVASSSAVMVLVAFSVLASFVYGTDTVLFVPISNDKLGTGADGYGYLLAGLGVGGVAGAALVNRLARSRRLAPAILGGIAVYCMPTALLVLVHQPLVAFVMQIARGAGTLVVDTLAITALQRSVPREMVARVFGVFFALVLGAISLGALITPAVLGAGLDTALLVYGLGIPALCLITLPRLLSMDRVAAAASAALAPRVAILERLDLFAAASRTGIERLAGAASEVTVPAGRSVVVEGEVADAFYVVVDGELEVAAVGERGVEPVLVSTLGAGTYFGEIGLIGRIPRTATVTAYTDCTLLRIEGQDFLDALTNLGGSVSLLEGARTRLSVMYPSKTGVIEREGRTDDAAVTMSAPAVEGATAAS